MPSQCTSLHNIFLKVVLNYSFKMAAAAALAALKKKAPFLDMEAEQLQEKRINQRVAIRVRLKNRIIIDSIVIKGRTAQCESLI